MVIKIKTINSKVVRFFILVLLIVQIAFVVSTHQGLGKKIDDNSNLIMNNPMPSYEIDNIKVENNIMFSCSLLIYADTINIYNVSDPLNFQYYASYTLNSHIDEWSTINKFQIFDDKLFIIAVVRNFSSPIQHQFTAIEIVDISDVHNPTYLSHVILDDASNPTNPYDDDHIYRMFFKDDLLFVSIYESYFGYNRTLRVLNCTDIYHPLEIARTNYFTLDYNLIDFYLLDNIVYTLTCEFEVNKLTIYNYSDISNITIISKSDLSCQPRCFVGYYNGFLIIDTNDGQYAFLINENYTLDFVNNWLIPSNYISSCIYGQRMFSITNDSIRIYDITDINDRKRLSFHLLYSDIDGARYMRFDLDKTRAYISGTSYEDGALLYIIDFSDELNPVQLIPEVTAITAIPLVVILFSLMIISLLSVIKKRKK